jgi:hypothetical protein
LKYELIYPGDFASGLDLFAALESYFRFYNHRRPHQERSRAETNSVGHKEESL